MELSSSLLIVVQIPWSLDLTEATKVEDSKDSGKGSDGGHADDIAIMLTVCGIIITLGGIWCCSNMARNWHDEKARTEDIRNNKNNKAVLNSHQNAAFQAEGDEDLAPQHKGIAEDHTTIQVDGNNLSEHSPCPGDSTEAAGGNISDA